MLKFDEKGLIPAIIQDAHSKEILILRDIEGVPYSDIARIVGINLSNVKVRIHRGRELLKKRLHMRGLL